jgi:hypothetical protein
MFCGLLKNNTEKIAAIFGEKKFFVQFISI